MMTVTTKPGVSHAVYVRRSSPRKVWRAILVYALLIVLSALFIFPFFYTVMS